MSSGHGARDLLAVRRRQHSLRRHIGPYLVGANFYDVWQQRRKGKKGVLLSVDFEVECLATATWTRRALPKVPGLVSVVVSAHNEEAAIVRTLDSIRRSTYRFFEVLVADDQGTTLETQQFASVLSACLREKPESPSEPFFAG